MVNLLKVEHIDVFYDAIQVLWNVSLHVNDGEIITLLGSNGAGKTTLLLSIIGLIRPRSGLIKYLDQDISKLSTYEIINRGICYVPERRRLFPYLTVMENLELGAITKNGAAKKEENLRRVFELFPILKERKDQIAGTLSGGEQQMLAIGRGLMSAPKLLMLDEPSVGLAPKVLRLISDVIKEINKGGVTVLLVEQNAKLALGICDRAYIIENGRLVSEAEKESLMQYDYIKKFYLGR